MSSSGRRAAAVAVVVGVALAWGGIASADQPLSATSYAIPTPVSGPAAITAGPDGTLWVTESTGGRLASITTTGVIGEPSGATGLTGPLAITAGVAGTASAGMLWFTEPSLRSVAEYTISTGMASSPIGLLGGDIPMPGGVAVDAQGNVWVTIANAGRIDRLAPPYTRSNETAYPAMPPDGGLAQPGSITRGHDGNMWFTEVRSDKIGTIGTQGQSLGTVTEYPSPVAGTLGQIVVGPDGNLWVGSVGTNGIPSAVLRITPAGIITPFDLPSGSSANPDVIAAGPDGQLWMAGHGTLTSVTTAGVFTSYPGILPAGDTISGIEADPGGADALWLTDQTAGTIYRVPLAPPAPPPPTPPSAPPTTPPPTPPTLAAVLAPVAALAKSSAMLAATISEPAGSLPTTVGYSFQYGISTAYGSSTPAATTTATASGVSVSATLAGLAPYTTYHYRLVASDCATSSCQTVTPDRSFTTGSTLQPVPNVTVGVTVTAGTILVKLHGHHGFTRLRAGELIPLGSTVDARHGTLLIQSAVGPGAGHLASGLFAGGVFVITQRPGTTVTVLALSSSFASCSAPTLTATARIAAAAAKKTKKPKRTKKKVSHKTVNEVFGNAHGQFSTRGHYATAADQGTGWRTADRCDGTLISVSAGKVTVTDFVHHRTLVLTAGHHYLARTH
jgi:virginiamycin B lyase